MNTQMKQAIPATSPSVHRSIERETSFEHKGGDRDNRLRDSSNFSAGGRHHLRTNSSLTPARVT